MADRVVLLSRFRSRSAPEPVSPIEKMLQTKRQGRVAVTLPRLKCLELEEDTE